MNTLHQQYLKAMDITAWQSRESVRTGHDQSSTTPHPTPTEINTNRWHELFQCVRNCTLCGLDRTRTNTVFGSGSEQADFLIVGEAPGASEDQQGAPFVGRAGTLLTEMLKAIGIERNQIFITNILKCHPPSNRDPLPYEVECCTPHLKKQIEILKPKLIVAVGRIAAQFFLGSKASLAHLRGQQYHYGENKIPLIVTYHPAYLLRSPKEKAKAYEDLLMIQKAHSQLINSPPIDSSDKRGDF